MQCLKNTNKRRINYKSYRQSNPEKQTQKNKTKKQNQNSIMQLNSLNTFNTKYYIYKLSFKIIELIAFLLPALPDLLLIRLIILTTYFVAHILGLPTQYMHMKNTLLESLYEPSTTEQKTSEETNI